MSEPKESLAGAIRAVLSRGAYQMPHDRLPYETQAAVVAEAVRAWAGDLSPEISDENLRQRQLLRVVIERDRLMAEVTAERDRYQLGLQEIAAPNPTGPSSMKRIARDALDDSTGMEAVSTELKALRSQNANLTLERDLAVAHDRQPYPTAEAYERACAAIEKHRERAIQAEAERDLLAGTLGSLWLYVNWRWLTKQLTTPEKEAWAACVERWSADLNGGGAETPVKADRWWLCPTCGINNRCREDDGPHENCAFMPEDEAPHV